MGRQKMKLEMRQEMKLKTRQKMKLETRQKMKLETRQKMKLEMRQEMKLKTRQEMKLEMRQETKLKMKLEMRQEMKLEMRQGKMSSKMYLKMIMKMKLEMNQRVIQEAEVIHISNRGKANTSNFMDSVTWSWPGIPNLLVLDWMYRFVRSLFDTGVSSRALRFVLAMTLWKSKDQLTLTTKSPTTGSTLSSKENKAPSVTSHWLTLMIRPGLTPSADLRLTWAPNILATRL